MLMKKKWLQLGVLTACMAGSIAFHQGARGAQAQQGSKELPKHPAPPVSGEHLVVQLCDGDTFLELKGVQPDARLTPEQAKLASDQLMMMWIKKQPKEVAEAWARDVALAQQRSQNQKRSSEPKKDETGKPAPPTNEQPIDFSQRDYAVWKKELEREVRYGDQIFHDDKLLGSTNGVSCAMCHPHGSNTHPETYPKFQIQLKRVAMLRDMINWCVENPSRGKKFDADDPKMRALEAYIMSQRKGVAMDPGKH
jgi:thiosulfate dehydrogenase